MNSLWPSPIYFGAHNGDDCTDDDAGSGFDGVDNGGDDDDDNADEGTNKSGCLIIQRSFTNRTAQHVKH